MKAEAVVSHDSKYTGNEAMNTERSGYTRGSEYNSRLRVLGLCRRWMVSNMWVNVVILIEVIPSNGDYDECSDSDTVRWDCKD